MMKGQKGKLPQTKEKERGKGEGKMQFFLLPDHLPELEVAMSQLTLLRRKLGVGDMQTVEEKVRARRQKLGKIWRSAKYK